MREQEMLSNRNNQNPLRRVSLVINIYKESNIFETNETTFLHTPEYLNYSVLTDQERIIVGKYLINNGLTDAARSVESYSYNPDNRNIFFKYMTHTNEYHGMDWKDYLPELYNLMNNN